MKRAIVTTIALMLVACGKSQTPVEQVLELASPCNATVQSCQAKGKEGSLVFGLSNARTMQPMSITAEWKGAAITSMMVDFNMVDMDMGQNRYRLVPDDKGNWTGTAVLPVCMQGRSDWVADVRLSAQDGGTYVVRIPFTVGP